MKPVRWGVLSTAGIGIKAMLPALRVAAGCDLRAIASRQQDRAEDVARQFGIEHAYGSYDDLLADPEIDAVYNPLPNHLHVPVTLQALKAGKHVLCEKPLAMTQAEARQVAEAALAAGRQVAEAFMVCHHPQWVRARELLREGRIGKTSAIQVLFSYSNTDPGNVRNRADIGGGGLYDIGCYAVRAGRWFFDSEPEAVCVVMDRDPAFGTDRLTTGAIRFPSGAHLGFTVATQSALTQQMTILGAGGNMLFDAPFNCPSDHAARLIIDDGSNLLGKDRQIEVLPPADQYRLQAEEFSRAIVSDEAPLNGPEDAIRNASAIEALMRAAASGQWEPVAT
ncbi:Gfo/Idh/MocA family protein [Paracoccus alkanivorans]|uniref:Gfo/Idh/MocA family oxidoreductase n=1 Tax=Paracoccus alkanivorans TaxID=2116655 RepID=A0A3M0MKA0_9RHOB|nr:Gfo/Idh/MocA family oxidoreductase [Paracoccus alkanivorans]RMC38031.1 gfo/Idh/MocA family oxidoreductase [Paracoccus alkanivorans]